MQVLKFASEFRDACATRQNDNPRLLYFAIPRYLEFVRELPTTESGKVEKYKLRERGVTERTWDREASDNRRTRQADARKRSPP
jgi:acyl-coenzyme A synthetase/AMP-(fatty) acid ligase